MKKHNQDYLNEMQKRIDELLAKAKTDQERDVLIKAYEITLKPFH